MMKTTRGRQFFLTLLACSCLCGAAVGQAGGGAGQPATPPRQGARAVGSVTAPPGWQRYEIHYAGGLVLRVVLPAPPEAESTPIPVKGFASATQHTFTAGDDKGVYVVCYLEGLPAALTADPALRGALFNGLWKGMAEGMREELNRQGLALAVTQQPARETDVSGHRAQVQDFAVGDKSGSARAVVSGAHTYFIVHISFAKEITPEGHSFLDSFDLRPER